MTIKMTMVLVSPLIWLQLEGMRYDPAASSRQQHITECEYGYCVTGYGVRGRSEVEYFASFSTRV